MVTTINNLRPPGCNTKRKENAMKRFLIYDELVIDERPVCVYGNTYIRFSETNLPVRVIKTVARYIYQSYKTFSLLWQN
jgi:hypothetical protein